MYTNLKIKGTKRVTLTARLSWPCKPGGVPFDCGGKQTRGETVCLNNWDVLLLLYLLTRTHTGLQSALGLTTCSDDRGWTRRWRVRVWRGRKIPEEPLAFTLPSLVQVVLLVALFTCSLVVVILLQVPHWWPAMFLKVFLVLCIRKKKHLCNLKKQSQPHSPERYCVLNMNCFQCFWTLSWSEITAHIS